jgi:hypothetical protein
MAISLQIRHVLRRLEDSGALGFCFDVGGLHINVLKVDDILLYFVV